MIRTYSELKVLPNFKDRYEYLRLKGKIGIETYGFDRIINQLFYHSKEWRRMRDQVIIRDGGCDLGCEGYEIHGQILIHHLNPVKLEDILNWNPDILNPEFLICTTKRTHNAIHYGDESLLPSPPTIRTRNDTCPWKNLREMTV